MSERFESMPTPPEETGMEKKSKFDSAHSSKQSGSLREAKSFIQRLIDLLSPFTPREIIDGEGKRWTLLAQEVSGPGDLENPPEWTIQNGKDANTARILIGTLNGLGLGGDGPAGKIVNEWYEFATDPDRRKAVVLRVPFEPNSFLRNYNEVEDFYGIDHGGSVAAYEMKLWEVSGFEDPIKPTVSASTGASTQDGVGLIVIGYVGGGRQPMNSFTGPIYINFCAPNSFVATTS